MTNSSLSHNDDDDGIDALRAINPSITVTGSTISYNTSGVVIYDAPNASLTVADSTISNNDDDGIDAARDQSPTVSVTSSTIADNYYGIEADPGTAPGITVSATILAGAGNRNCGEPVTDGGYNLSTDAYCGFSGTSRQNVSDSALNLQSLDNNGGPTETRALGPGSVAIDAIPVDSQGQCSAGTQVDQRGVLRPQGAGCDIGAFEVVYPLAALPGTTSTVQRGYYALLRFYPTNSNGRDAASRTLKVSAVALYGPNNQTISFVHPFQLGSFGGQAGYQLSLNTRNLTPGGWTMEVRVGSGASASYGWITFTVE